MERTQSSILQGTETGEGEVNRGVIFRERTQSNILQGTEAGKGK